MTPIICKIIIEQARNEKYLYKPDFGRLADALVTANELDLATQCANLSDDEDKPFCLLKIVVAYLEHKDFENANTLISHFKNIYRNANLLGDKFDHTSSYLADRGPRRVIDYIIAVTDKQVESQGVDTALSTLKLLLPLKHNEIAPRSYEALKSIYYRTLKGELDTTNLLLKREKVTNDWKAFYNVATWLWMAKAYIDMKNIEAAKICASNVKDDIKNVGFNLRDMYVEVMINIGKGYEALHLVLQEFQSQESYYRYTIETFIKDLLKFARELCHAELDGNTSTVSNTLALSNIKDYLGKLGKLFDDSDGSIDMYSKIALAHILIENDEKNEGIKIVKELETKERFNWTNNFFLELFFKLKIKVHRPVDDSMFAAIFKNNGYNRATFGMILRCLVAMCDEYPQNKKIIDTISEIRSTLLEKATHVELIKSSEALCHPLISAAILKELPESVQTNPWDRYADFLAIYDKDALIKLTAKTLSSTIAP